MSCRVMLWSFEPVTIKYGNWRLLQKLTLITSFKCVFRFRILFPVLTSKIEVRLSSDPAAIASPHLSNEMHLTWGHPRTPLRFRLKSIESISILSFRGSAIWIVSLSATANFEFFENGLDYGAQSMMF